MFILCSENTLKILTTFLGAIVTVSRPFWVARSFSYKAQIQPDKNMLTAIF